MAITVESSNGQTIREFLESVTNIESISLPKEETITGDSSIRLVWEGSEYYLVEENGTSITIRNLDTCLPMVITKTAQS